MTLVVAASLTPGSEALGAPQTEWHFAYPAPGTAVAAAVADWVQDEHRRRLPPIERLAEIESPFAEVDEVTRFDLPAMVGPLEFDTRASMSLKGTGLVSSTLDVAFEKTGTIGESAVWRRIAQDLDEGVRARLAEADRPTEGEIVAGADADLRADARCASIARVLKSSPYPQATELLAGAVFVSPCGTEVLDALAFRPGGPEAAEAVIVPVAQSATPNQRHAVWAALTTFPKRTPAMDAALATLEAAKDADRRAAEAARTAARVEGQVQARARVQSYRGPWKAESEVSPVDDSLSVYFSRRAAGSIHGWPNLVFTPELWLRCKEGAVETYVVTGMQADVEVHEMSLDWATVVLRLDSDAADETRAHLSTDRRGLFVEGGAAVMAEMVGHRSMFLRFTPFRSAPQDMTFPLDGVDEVVEIVRLACGWTL